MLVIDFLYPFSTQEPGYLGLVDAFKMSTNEFVSTLPPKMDGEAVLQKEKVTELFGGESKWEPESWTASDDRVRGGRSQSYMNISEDKSTATFHGDLDITALGGAGFASQRTTDAAGGPWDLSKADGVCIGLGEVDSRIYTLVLKDNILPNRPDGREQSTISYEFSFSVVNTTDSEPEKTGSWETNPPTDLLETPYAVALPWEADASIQKAISAPIAIWVPWRAFHPFYRGKRKPEDGTLDPLDKSKIERISIMCRSMFGKQFGPFSVEIQSIAAFSVSHASLITSGTLFKRLLNTPSFDGTKDIYIFHRSLSAEKKPESGSAQGDEQGLVENLRVLAIGEDREPPSLIPETTTLE